MKPVNRLVRLFSALCLLAALGACSGDSGPSGEAAMETAKIEGEVFYRERMLLPPGAEVEVQLQDISRADAPASVMATVMLTPDKPPPWPFSISYRPADIDQRMRYALRATVSVEGRLMFSSTEYIDPFAGNPVQVLVRRVAEPVRPTSPAAPAQQAPDDSASVGPKWVLDTLDGEAAPLGAGGRAIDLVLDQEAARAAGFSGCNRYTGSFSSEGQSTHGTPIAFGPLAGTRMACADGGESEQAYLKMLGLVDAYRMEGDELALLAGDKVVATFHLE